MRIRTNVEYHPQIDADRRLLGRINLPDDGGVPTCALHLHCDGTEQLGNGNRGAAAARILWPLSAFIAEQPRLEPTMDRHWPCAA